MSGHKSPPIPGAVVLARFAETLPIRRSEWLLAAAMLSMGIVYSINATLFERPYFATMARCLPQGAWAVYFVLVGGLRLFALIRNGGWRHSPHLRAIGAFFSAMGWMQLAIAAAQNDILGQSVALWPLFFFADAHAAFTAMGEAKVNDVAARCRKPARNAANARGEL